MIAHDGGIAPRAPMLLLACLAACAGTPEEPPVDEQLTGGSIEAPGCGHRVTTTRGAGVPVPVDGETVGDDPAPRRIHLGSSGPATSSIVIGWRTGDEVTGQAEVRVWGGDVDLVVQPLTWRYQTLDAEPHRIYEAHVCGLAADAGYQYQVTSGGVTSETLSFRTLPDPATRPDAELVALVLGDSRGKPEVLADLIEQADSLATPDLLLFTGDAVQHGSNQEQWDAFLDAAAPLVQRVPALFAVGNHEDGDQALYSLWAMPGDEHNYTVDLGPASLAAADDTSWLLPDETGDGQAFLARALPAMPADDWRIVMHHQPIYSNDDGGSLRLRERWLPLFEEHRVELVLEGHHHAYQRSLPLRGGAIDPAGTTYLVTAGAGAPLYGTSAGWWTAAVHNGYHFVVLRIRRRSIAGTVHDDLGNRIDSFLLWKPERR